VCSTQCLSASAGEEFLHVAARSTANLTIRGTNPRPATGIVVEPKVAVGKRLGSSPDVGEAVAVAGWITPPPAAPKSTTAGPNDPHGELQKCAGVALMPLTLMEGPRRRLAPPRGMADR
jgi:hypothetical protein